MTLTLELPPELEKSLEILAEERGQAKEDVARDFLVSAIPPFETLSQGIGRVGRKTAQAPPPLKEWQIRALDGLRQMEEGDPEEQRETLEYLERVVDEDRPGQRSVFGTGVNPMPGETKRA